MEPADNVWTDFMKSIRGERVSVPYDRTALAEKVDRDLKLYFSSRSSKYVEEDKLALRKDDMDTDVGQFKTLESWMSPKEQIDSRISEPPAAAETTA